jgi:acetyl esterase/lipase
VLWSLSKSFTSTAVGLAVVEGKLSVDDPVLKFFPEDAPAKPSENLKAMRVRDLLTMSTGHETEAQFATNKPWVQSFLAQPVPYKPGTHFLYNTPGTYMLSAIVQKVTGQTVLDYLRPRLFEPLGIENPQWDSSPQGITLGGWGLKIRTEDIAKFGQLYLQKGKWNDKQLVPTAWIEQATAKQVSNGSDPTKDWDQGYGFLFWRCRHGAYRGDGANGQFCIVLPQQDAVIAITADTRDMQGELNLVWDKLLGAFHASPLPANVDEEAKLKQALTNLAVPAMHVENVMKPLGSAPEASSILKLWPDKAPGEKGDIGPEHDTTTESGDLIAGRRVIRLGNVSEPAITIYRPAPSKDTGAAVVVCPGGGYTILALDLEGTEVCEWLNSIGVTGILLKYRVPDREGHTAALQDAQRAVGLVRYNAKTWGIDAHKIGILGFSAGGHLSAALGAHYAKRTYPKVDAADEVSCRPDFTILIYPGGLAAKGEKGEAIVAPELTITSNTPPTFVVVAMDDPLVSVESVMSYGAALHKAQVPFELHVYPTGGHGYGLRPTKNCVTTWPDRVTDWMQSHGWLSREQP